MAFDKSLPPGNTKISQGDNSIRSNNEALEDALGGLSGDGGDLGGAGTPRPGEHRFETGDDQSGRHIFKFGTLAQVQGLAVAAADDGWVAFVTDQRGNRCWYYYDGSDWQPADIAVTDVPRIDEQDLVFTTVQQSSWELLTFSGSDLTPKFDGAPMQRANVPASTAINILDVANPTPVAGATIYLELTNLGAGSSINSWGAGYVAPNGVAPGFADGSGAVNLYTLTRLNSGNVLVTAVNAIGSF